MKMIKKNLPSRKTLELCLEDHLENENARLESEDDSTTSPQLSCSVEIYNIRAIEKGLCFQNELLVFMRKILNSME